MKRKKNLLTICVVTILVLLPSISVAQVELTWALSRIPTESVPFEATKTTPFLQGYNYALVNPNNVIPDMLYDNVQLTEYTHASNEPELCGTAFRKFAIPNSSNKLLVVAFGGVTDWETYVICVVNPSGNVLSSLECEVRVMDVYVKQFRITADNKIIVTSITPTSTTSIPFTFTSFTGYRRDITYSVDSQGQFVQESVLTYNAKTYTNTYLSDRNTNLWQGTETLQPFGQTGEAIYNITSANTAVETKSKFIEPFFVEPNVELTPYVLKHTLVPVVTVNNRYFLKFYKFKGYENEPGYNVVEIEREFYIGQNRSIMKLTLLQLQTSNGFAGLSQNQDSDISSCFRVVKLADETYAVILKEWTYASQPPMVSIILIRQGYVSLVFNMPNFIESIISDSGQFDITLCSNTVEYGDNGQPLQDADRHHITWDGVYLRYQ